ncbi:MAG: hypothetical protein GXP49_05865 [Deltaproteobacteria bacterium]|nr:hypothetical protein [Deltaproteobacteria bacterium]
MIRHERIMKVLVPGLLMGWSFAASLQGCGGKQECNNLSGTWYLSVFQEDKGGQLVYNEDYSQDTCTVEQRGCDLTVDCVDGTVTYGSVDGDVASFPLEWLNGSDAVVHATCKVEKSGAVSYAGLNQSAGNQSAGLGCFIGSGANQTYRPIFFTINCQELAGSEVNGKVEWKRISAPGEKKDDCDFASSFAENYEVEQNACLVFLKADSGWAAEPQAYLNGSDVALQWPELGNMPAGIKDVMLGKGAVVGPDETGEQYLKIPVSFWTTDRPNVENHCSVYYQLPKAF